MVFTMAEGKFPKKPNDGIIIETCRKEFRNFSKDHEEKLINSLNSQIKTLNQIGVPSNDLKQHIESLKSIKKLVKEGKEDIAFTIFFKTFPSCLPHRSR
ncbi:MAG: hypothetical protein ACFFEY_05280 [Candidatus Thorarchaeota archaeon]